MTLLIPESLNYIVRASGRLNPLHCYLTREEARFEQGVVCRGSQQNHQPNSETKEETEECDGYQRSHLFQISEPCARLEISTSTLWCLANLQE